MALITTFPNEQEYRKAKTVLDSTAVAYRIVSPQIGFAAVGIPAIVIDDQDRSNFGRDEAAGITIAGWVEFREPDHKVPDTPPPIYGHDIFGRTAMQLPT